MQETPIRRSAGHPRRHASTSATTSLGGIDGGRRVSTTVVAIRFGARADDANRG
jgi:hypothetical protein